MSRSRRPAGNKRRLAAAVAATAGAVLLAACSSSSSSGAASSPGSGGTASAAASGSSGAVAQAKAELAKYAGVPAFQAPGPALNAASLKGKLIVVVAHDQVANYLVAVYQGIQAAAQAAGIRTQLINGNGVVSTIQQGVLQAIHEHAAAIILDGADGALVTPQLKQAAAAHIPVVDAPLVPEPNLYASIDPNVELMGRLMADQAIVQTNGNVHAAIITFNSPIVPPSITGFKAVLAACSSCSVVTTQDVEPTSWPTQVAPTTVNMIRANPSLNVVVPIADSMLPFAVEGVKQAKAVGKVYVIGGDGEPFAVQDITTTGNIVVGDPGGSVPWIGWLSMDAALRAVLGMKPGNEVLPLRSIGSTSDFASGTQSWTSLYGDSYVAGFEKLWGV